MNATSPDRSTVLVTGATGAQGGSVARALLEEGRFAVRALTRKPDSPAARALADAGAEVVTGDLADRASLDAALAGCSHVFGLTQFWEHFGEEYVQGRNLLEAVDAAGVEHLVLSTLDSPKKRSGGKYEVPHCDIKARLEDEAREMGLPATFVRVAFYYENFLTFFPLRRQEDGTYATAFAQHPEVPLAMVSVDDVGGVVRAVLADRERFLGRAVGVVGDHRTAPEYAADLSRHLGVPVRYDYIPPEQFAALGFPGADDLAAMFAYQNEVAEDRTGEMEEARALHPGLRSFDQWLAEEKGRFAGALEG